MRRSTDTFGLLEVVEDDEVALGEDLALVDGLEVEVDEDVGQEEAQLDDRDVLDLLDEECLRLND